MADTGHEPSLVDDRRVGAIRFAEWASQKFESHRAIESGIERAVDVAKTAAADQCGQREWAPR